jgi:two-component system phosphate regulon sensor histidine kinase PhoR
MESGKKEFHLADIELNPIVRKVIAQYEPHMTHLGFSLRTELADALPLIRADAEAVSEALLNVLDNAMKYSADQKSIRIASGVAAEHVFVEVEDHGIGISPSDQPKIFDKFYRASSGLEHHTRGSGLGLTLVQHIMAAHEGSVSVTSQPGVGSTFRLSFPRIVSSVH